MSKKHKRVCLVSSYNTHLLILVSTIMPSFASLVCILIYIESSAVGLKISVITGGIRKCKSIIKKKRKRHDKILSLV